MRRRLLHPPHRVGHVNITPMIDVLMCLIVFYLIVGKLASDRLPPMDLPLAVMRDERAPGEDFVISVRPAGDGLVEILVDASPVTLGVLAEMVSARFAAEPHVTVLVRADRRLTYAHVSPVIAACRRAGAKSVDLAVERGR